MSDDPQITRIRAWAAEDRPREKLLAHGTKSLSNAELIAILLGSGTAGQNAVEVARRLLQNHRNQLSSLSRLSIAGFMKVKGIGPAKAITLVAALELGRRRQSESPERVNFTSSTDVYHYIGPSLQDLPHEEFWLILLNRANVLITSHCLSKGGVAGTVVDAKLIFKSALDHRACGIIVAHNHPSGQLKPSEADKQITKKLQKGGSLLEIKMLDHIIIGQNGYFSFADEGYL